MAYFLSRTRDGAGDCGLMTMNIWEEDGEVKYEYNEKPKVGAVVRVGSINVRSYSSQDYWTTSKVTEILEEAEDFMRFKTGNSEYIWRIQ